MDSILQSLPASLQRDIQLIPPDVLVKVLQDIVAMYKKKLEDGEIDALIAEADQELTEEGKSSKSIEQRRAEFIQTCNHIAAKYF